MFSRGSRDNRVGWFALAFGFGGIILLLLLSISGLVPSLPASAQDSTQILEEQTIYMPLIPSGSSAATPVATIASGAQVYGLVGTIEQPTGRTYMYYLSTAHNGYYALAGQTPAIEQEIATLAQTNDKPSVKVWGEVHSPESADEPPLIVVTGILATEATVPTPVAGASVPIAVVKYDAINMYAGPGSTYQVVGQVVLRQACEVTGRNETNSWLQLTCADGQQGWVDARLVDVTGDLSQVVVINTVAPTATPTMAAATATPTATPQTIYGWRTEIFNNSNLSGVPVAVADVPTINFDWGSGGPSQVAPDNFSIRFARRVTVTPAFYQFTATADDGVRIWVDGRLILNAWPAVPGQKYTVGQVLTGSHDLVVEYYELSGLANLRVDYAVATVENSWQASYYFGTTPSGNPAFTQQEARGPGQYPLDYNWSSGSPQSATLGPGGLGNDYWSARWQGDFPFEGGNFVFNATVDDGIRLYLDGLLVLDFWQDGYKQVSNRVIGVGQGRHTVVVEYYERTGNASVQAYWYCDSAYVGPQ